MATVGVKGLKDTTHHVMSPNVDRRRISRRLHCLCRPTTSAWIWSSVVSSE